MDRRSFLIAMFGPSLVLALASGGCSSSGSSGEAGRVAGNPSAPVRVKLALNWVPEPEFGGFYAGREAGFYKEEGIDLEIIKGGPGVPVVQMVASGQVDFAVSGADEVLTSWARGVELAPLFAIYQTSPVGIMAHASRATLSEVFSSGTVAMEPGLAPSLFLKKKYGFDKVKIVPYDGGVARFLADEGLSQQCFVTSEPIAVRKQGMSPRVFMLADEGFNPYTGVVVTRLGLVSKEADLAARFVRATRRGWQSYLESPGPANEVMARLNPAMDLATFGEVAAAQKELIETAESKAKGLGSMSRERWETLSKQLVDLGLIERAPDLGRILITLPEPSGAPKKP